MCFRYGLLTCSIVSFVCVVAISADSVLVVQAGAARDLPDQYVPGSALTVCIAIVPPPGTSAIGVEDSPQPGWEVSNVSAGGHWDPIYEKVKWGPFFAPFPDQVCYEVTPPMNATGEYCFTGTVSFDGANQPVEGDECVPEEPATYGACCYPDEACANDVADWECAADGGRYLGEGLACDDDPDDDGVFGCNDVCPSVTAPGGTDSDGRPLGDLDADCDVDLNDFAIMQLNFTGPPVP